MATIGISDLASMLSLKTQQNHIRSALDTSSKELATGRKENLYEASGGNIGQLFSVERTLNLLSSETTSITLAESKLSVTQFSLEQVQNSLSGFGAELLGAVNGGNYRIMNTVAASAKGKLETSMQSLNARSGQQAVFSGAATDRPALASAKTLMDDISIIVSGSANAAAALAAIDNYFFSPAGGFDTNIYQGSVENSGPLVGESGAKIEYSIRADSDEIRHSLRALSIAAVVSENSTFSGTVDQTILLREAAESTISATDGVIGVRAQVGISEEAVANIKVQNTSKTTIFELERSALTAADPFDTASIFEALRVQLESVYTITARLSNLSLVNYLR